MSDMAEAEAWLRAEVAQAQPGSRIAAIASKLDRLRADNARLAAELAASKGECQRVKYVNVWSVVEALHLAAHDAAADDMKTAESLVREGQYVYAVTLTARCVGEKEKP
jgi:hypothetical protein